MKLHEASAVLLIIGQAVVGPIEQQCNLYELGINCIGRETIAQTCERAMKEIGAYKVNEGLSLWNSDTQSTEFGPTSESWRLKDGMYTKRVRCIPAPSGLK